MDCTRYGNITISLGYQLTIISTINPTVNIHAFRFFCRALIFVSRHVAQAMLAGIRAPTTPGPTRDGCDLRRICGVEGKHIADLLARLLPRVYHVERRDCSYK
jgi:hypothetical protein